MSLNRYLKSHTLQFYSVYQSDTAFLIIRRKDNEFQTKGDRNLSYIKSNGQDGEVPSVVLAGEDWSFDS